MKIFWSFLYSSVLILILFIALGLLVAYETERISKKKMDAVKRISEMVLDCLRNNANGATQEEIAIYINERENSFKLGWIRPQVHKFLQKSVADGRLEKFKDGGTVKFRFRLTKEEQAQKRMRKVQETENHLKELQEELKGKMLDKMNEHN